MNVAGLIGFLDKSYTLNDLRGHRMYRLLKVGVWNRAGFIASIGSTTGNESGLLSISACLSGSDAPNVSYSVTNPDIHSLCIYKRIVSGYLEVYLYSTLNSDSFICVSGLSSQPITNLGEVEDLSQYTLVASL